VILADFRISDEDEVEKQDQELRWLVDLVARVTECTS